MAHIVALQPALQFGRPDANLATIRRDVKNLVNAATVDVVVLPEIVDGDPEPNDGGRLRRFFSELAADCGVHVVGGSSLVVDADGRQYNRCHVVSRAGAVVGQYDKRIMFSNEADARTPGSHAGVFTLGTLRVGVLICADLWHPELARELIGRVDVLAVPTKTSVPAETQIEYARENWRAMALTRAMENGLVVAVADWPAGRHESQRLGNGVSARRTHYTSGATCVIDPSHRPDMNRIRRTIDGAGSIVAGIDVAALNVYREYRQRVGLLPRVERDAADDR